MNFMMTDAETFLKRSIEQDELFDKIKADVNNILKYYNLKKHTDIKQTDIDTISVTVQEEIPDKLISDLNEYFGFPSRVTHDTFNLILKYIYP